MIAEDISDLPATTLARTIRNQHPDTVVLTFLGPAENGKVDLIEQAGTRTLVSPFTEAKQLVARLDELAEAWRDQGPRAPLHPGVPRAPLRLPAPLRRDQDQDRARDERGPGLRRGPRPLILVRKGPRRKRVGTPTSLLGGSGRSPVGSRRKRSSPSSELRCSDRGQGIPGQGRDDLRGPGTSSPSPRRW